MRESRVDYDPEWLALSNVWLLEVAWESGQDRSAWINRIILTLAERKQLFHGQTAWGSLYLHISETKADRICR